jgi:hypothetical protein
MKDPNRFYTYAYLREDRTPYYIGKGCKKRVYYKYKNDIKPPEDKSRIIFLKDNLTEEEAFKHEIYMISVFGRKDLGTGILHNRTDGGDGSSNMSEETKQKLREARKRQKHPFLGKSHSEESRKKMSEVKSGKNHPNYGKSPSKETRRKQSESMKGIKYSKESLEKRSATRSYWWKLTFVNGNEIIILNLNKWSRENGYNCSNIRQIASGKRNRHKDIVSVVKLSQGNLKTDASSGMIHS